MMKCTTRHPLFTGVICTLFLGLAILAQAVQAGDLSPTEVIQGAINDVATDMRSNAAIYEKDTGKLHAMVTERAEIYFNFSRMTQLAMAKHATEATPDQRKAVVQEFRASFIRSYANTLFLYRNVNPTIQLQPGSTDTKATVKMNVKSETGEATTLMLRLEKTDDRWRIIDVTAEGVSLVINARSQFADTIAKSGIDGLINSLREENLKNAP